MNQDNIELLITRSLDGTITPEEFERLETVLDTDESARETLVLMAVQDVQIGRLLREQLGIDLTTASEFPPVQHGGSRILRFLAPLAAAAAILLIVGALWVQGPTGGPRVGAHRESPRDPGCGMAYRFGGRHGEAIP